MSFDLTALDAAISDLTAKDTTLDQHVQDMIGKYQSGQDITAELNALADLSSKASASDANVEAALNPAPAPTPQPTPTPEPTPAPVDTTTPADATGSQPTQ